MSWLHLPIVRSSLALLALSVLVGCNLDDDGPLVGPGNNVGVDAATGDDSGMTETDLGMGEDAGSTMGDAGVDEDAGTELATLVVFDETYAAGVSFATFGGATNEIQVVDGQGVDGSSGIRVRVPATGYTGGALVGAQPADLRGYTALQFKVRASISASLNVAGFGNSTTSDVQTVERRDIAISDQWTQITLPLPNPEKLAEVGGLFHFAEGADEGSYDLFFDDIEFVALPMSAFASPSASFPSVNSAVFLGDTRPAPETSLTIRINGTSVTVALGGAHMDWTSTDSRVATVNDAGLITAVAAGTASIRGTLRGQSVSGELNLTIVEGPGRPAPTPTIPPFGVDAAIYSDAYPANTVDTFLASFSSANLTPIVVDGNNTLLYTDLDFAGIEMLGVNSIDVERSRFLRVDVWTSNGVLFGVKLVDFGDNNAFGGGDDTEFQVDLTASEGLRQGQWVTFEIPLADFEGGLRARKNLSQIILVGRSNDPAGNPVPGASVFFVDNILFYR